MGVEYEVYYIYQKDGKYYVEKSYEFIKEISQGAYEEIHRRNHIALKDDMDEVKDTTTRILQGKRR